MKRFLKPGLVILFTLLILFGSLTLHTVVQSQHYSRLVNYVGIVRGASQRLVKLELMDQPANPLIEYLDGILEELTTGNGGYGLFLPEDESYRENLDILDRMWTDIKEQIRDYRSGMDKEADLLSLSEAFFNQANDTVFAADEYAAGQVRTLFVICTVMLGIMLLTWVFILWAYWKKMLRLENSNQKLNELTRRDNLTGVYQMDFFKEEAQRILDAGTSKKLAVVYTDFSDFKYINDVFGYAYGDSILKRYGEILNKMMEPGELCGRVSADNFVLLLRYQEREEAALRQQKADEEITRFMHNSHDHQSVPTCCGICCVEDVTEDLNIDGFLDRANFARKTVKNGTNSNYVYYNESIRSRLREEKDVESRMLVALENREFVVFYQPKVELKTGKTASSESLVRWKSQGGSIIPPDRFIPVFESKYMIDRLDQYVFEEVCRFLSKRLKEGKKVLPVSVNVSRLQFFDQNFVNRYVEIRDRYQVPPELLEIEFTESIAIDNTNILTRIVERLRQAGFSCSIDDFGKGYSSLSLLKTLPFDVLKIDRFFFAESNDPERDMDVVQGIVELVHKFHIKTVAEGVESKKQVEMLKQIGCDYVQGYVFYRPMPQDEYERLLDEADHE
ncbi:EAL domain-containing protein [Clostridium sp. MCC353]|uniref:putative bifunctional diguanylate cyclase/phosphodiesterase n=1 Tax=Clostridium sp. MCC353 TaxID=2592646 RepID=UPI001C0228E2|nr:GGDEF domain-containing phosphodiesterase [Clostridium sp. MCC353]MBT9776950.1 EAL domain-containing protein [Clostridium sp. MCC353]